MGGQPRTTISPPRRYRPHRNRSRTITCRSTKRGPRRAHNFRTFAASLSQRRGNASLGRRGRRTGCRVRRHRDQPDLHHPDCLQPQRPAPRADQRGQRVRRRVIDFLVGDDHRHADLRHPGDARRQRRRGRHHGAHHAAAALGRRRAPASHRHGVDHAGPLRRRAVLRRQHDHPRDLGAVRGRGHQGHPAGVGKLDRADHGGDHRCAVRRAAPRHGRRWAPVRAGDDRLVRIDRRLSV